MYLMNQFFLLPFYSHEFIFLIMSSLLFNFFCHKLHLGHVFRHFIESFQDVICYCPSCPSDDLHSELARDVRRRRRFSLLFEFAGPVKLPHLWSGKSRNSNSTLNLPSIDITSSASRSHSRVRGETESQSRSPRKNSKCWATASGPGRAPLYGARTCGPYTTLS